MSSLFGVGAFSFITGFSSGHLWKYAENLGSYKVKDRGFDMIKYRPFKEVFNSYLTAPFKYQFWIMVFGLITPISLYNLYKEYHHEHSLINNSYNNSYIDELNKTLNIWSSWIIIKMIVCAFFGCGFGHDMGPRNW